MFNKKLKEKIKELEEKIKELKEEGLKETLMKGLDIEEMAKLQTRHKIEIWKTSKELKSLVQSLRRTYFYSNPNLLRNRYSSLLNLLYTLLIKLPDMVLECFDKEELIQLTQKK